MYLYLALRALFGLSTMATAAIVCWRMPGTRKLLAALPPLLWVMGEFGLKAILTKLGRDVDPISATLMVALEIGGLAAGLSLAFASARAFTRRQMLQLERSLDAEQQALAEGIRGPFR